MTIELPQTLCVEVTWDDIHNARGDEYTCPLALAICRELGLDVGDVEVDSAAGAIHIYANEDPAAYGHTLQSAAFVSFYDGHYLNRDQSDETTQLMRPVSLCLGRVA